ncbi:MAG: DMT family transporter [Clostridia bacterium]|nr:DMT family transporter [Clostridia bacterium]
MFWIFYKKKPDVWCLIAAVLCTAGIGFIGLRNGRFEVTVGAWLSLASAVMYGLQIIIIAKNSKKCDDMAVLFFELAVVGVGTLIGSLIFESGEYAQMPIFNGDVLFSVLYLTLFCTLLAQACQMIGQKHVKASQSAIILSLESVFGFAFSAMLGGETFDLMPIIGFVLIFVAVFISETKLEFITRRFKKGSVENG